MKTFEIENFPAWALCYAINCDPLDNDDDMAMVDNYLDQLCDELGWYNLTITTKEMENEIHESFSAFPAFGLPCECVNVIAVNY